MGRIRDFFINLEHNLLGLPGTKVSEVGPLEFLKEDKNNPDAILIRSHVLTENDFNKSLKCICRAGAGVNHIPLEQATQEDSCGLFVPELNNVGVELI